MANLMQTDVPVMTDEQVPNIPAFADVATLNPSSGVASEDWNVDHFSSIKIWRGVAVDDAQISIVGASWLNEVNNGTISTQTAIKGLRLAMSLKSMNPEHNETLLREQERIAPAENEAASSTLIPEVGIFSSTAFTLRTQQVIQGPNQEVGTVNGVSVNNAPPQNGTTNNAPDTEAQRRVSYCFLAMYMMKIITKAPENLVAGVENMKSRFETFYGPSQTVRQFSLTLEKATAYKEAVSSQAKISVTYTHAVAYTHQNHVGDLDTKEVGVLGFLCFLPLSYMGLHAYTLMLELMHTTKVQLNCLLSMFYVDVTGPALLKISHIVRNFERTESQPNRDVTFRYCTHWGPQYFSVLRSRNCSHLLYTLACTWKELNAGNDQADPERIAATGRLSVSMKHTLKYAGRIIGKTLAN